MNQPLSAHSRRLVNERAAREHTGIGCRTTRYYQEKDGTFPPGIVTGTNSRRWFLYELDQLNAARARGASDDEMRELVKRIIEARKALVIEPVAV